MLFDILVCFSLIQWSKKRNISNCATEHHTKNSCLVSAWWDSIIVMSRQDMDWSKIKYLGYCRISSKQKNHNVLGFIKNELYLKYTYLNSNAVVPFYSCLGYAAGKESCKLKMVAKLGTLIIQRALLSARSNKKICKERNCGNLVWRSGNTTWIWYKCVKTKKETTVHEPFWMGQAVAIIFKPRIFLNIT